VPSLVELNLFQTQLTDASLDHLKNFPNLRRLDLSHTPITDAGLPALIELQNLRELVLDGTDITSAGLVAVSKLKSLTSLDICRTRIDDLSAIKSMPALSDLAAYGLTVSAEDEKWASSLERGSDILDPDQAFEPSYPEPPDDPPE
jgi:Leucine-rich repeat (LRR) protein